MALRESSRNAGSGVRFCHKRTTVPPLDAAQGKHLDQHETDDESEIAQHD
jgi:hypothetical protein